MKYKFILFSPWLLKSPVKHPHHSSLKQIRVCKTPLGAWHDHITDAVSMHAVLKMMLYDM